MVYGSFCPYLILFINARSTRISKRIRYRPDPTDWHSAVWYRLVDLSHCIINYTRQLLRFYDDPRWRVGNICSWRFVPINYIWCGFGRKPVLLSERGICNSCFSILRKTYTPRDGSDRLSSQTEIKWLTSREIVSRFHL